MDKSSLEYNLLQLISEISMIDDLKEITGCFITALNLLRPEASFSFSTILIPGASGCIEVRTRQNTCGYLNYTPGGIPAEEITILDNIAGMLALVIENRSQAKLIDEYKKSGNTLEKNRALENRLSRIAEVSPAVISEYIWHPDGSFNYLYVSPASEDVFGIRPDEIINQPDLLLQRVDAKQRENTRESSLSSIRDHAVFSFEIKYLHPVKGEIWLQSHASCVPETGGYLHIYDFTIDGTDQKRAEEALRESEERYRGIFENAAIGIFLAALDGRLTSVNPTLARMHAFESTGEMIEHTASGWALAVHPEEGKMFFGKVLDEGEFNGFEMEMYRTDRSTFWVSLAARIVKDANGNPLYFEGIVEDITKRKRTEQDLRSRDEQMMSIVENTAEIIHIIDPGGNFIFISPSWEQSTGFPVSETVGRSFIDYVHPEDAPACIKVFRDVLETGKPHKIMEFRVKHASGKWIWFINSGVAIKDADGKTVNFMGISMDITERKQSEKEILRERDFSRAVINSLPGLFYIINSEGRFIRWNRNLNTVSGYSDEEISRISILNLASPEYQPIAKTIVEEVLTKGHVEGEAYLKAADGTVRPFLTNGSLFYNDNKPFIIGVSYDISDRKHLEEQLMQSQKMEAVGQLAGGMAHDFNNLLQAILGYIELVLMKMPSSDPNYPRLCEVKRAGERASVLTRQMLAFSRRQVLQLSLIDINEVIADLIKMLNRLLGEDIELVFKPGKHASSAKADRSQIEQVLTNLCVNARDAMPGGGRLVIETSDLFADETFVNGHEWAKPGHYICISVTDTGSGMDNKTVKKIFEPFFTTKEKGKGTGLGLAMVYGIIRQHQGMVQVYSEPGSGSCFRIYLPADNTGLTSENIQEEHAEAAGGSETILLAEDDNQIRELACGILEEAGYMVLPASDGQEAFEIFRENSDRINLLFLDVIMPRQSGGAVYDRAREINPVIKCLFASGYSRDGLHNNYILDEGLHLLQKPYTRDAMLLAVRRVLDE